MCAVYTREDIHIRRQTIDTNPRRKNTGRHHRGWHKEFYGKPMSRSKYFQILEEWDDCEGCSVEFKEEFVSDECDVSEAMVRAVVRDRENYRNRKCNKAVTQ